MDFNQAIKPLVIWSRLCGLAPYSPVRKADSKGSYQISKRWMVYNFLWLGLIGTTVTYKTVSFVYLTVPRLELLSFGFCCNILIKVCENVSFVHFFYTSFINRYKILGLIKKIEKIATILDITNDSFKNCKLFLVIQVILSVFMYIPTLVPLILLGWPTPLEWASYALRMLCDMSLLIPLIQFGNLALMLGQLLRVLTVKLAKCENEPSLFRRRSPPTTISMRGHCQSRDNRIIPISTISPKTPRPRVYNQGSGNPITSGKDFDQNRDWFERFDASTVHSALYDIAEQINSLFEFQNLISIFIIYLEILYRVFSCIHYSPNYVTSFSYYVNVGGFIFKMLQQLTMLLFVVFSCQSLSLQVKKFAFTVSKLQSNASSPRLRNQMDTFSLQLLQRKIRFLACGQFPIDATLVHSIVTGVTTYLVILIQFSPPKINELPSNTTAAVYNNLTQT